MKLLALALAIFALSSEEVQSGEIWRGKHYEVDLYIILDQAAYSIYLGENNNDDKAATLSAMADLDFFVTEMNKHFASLKDLSIQVGEFKMRILKASDPDIYASSGLLHPPKPGKPATKKTLDVTKGLKVFDTWLKGDSVGSGMGKTYDIALLWTGLDLMDPKGNTGVAGFAWKGTVCNTWRASAMVEYDGDYNGVTTAAHEIGHNLGSEHDPPGLLEKHYIMTPVTDFESPNRWDFSVRTEYYFKKTMERLGSNNCMLKKEGKIPKAPITGTLSNPDTVCKRAYGKNSYFCHSEGLYKGPAKGDAVCSRIYCNTKGTSCYTTETIDGMVCGQGKSCQKGHCVDDPHMAGKVDESCLYGDQATVVLGSFVGTCKQYLAEKGEGKCRSWPAVKQLCCASCPKADPNAPKDCPFGDTPEFKFNHAVMTCAQGIGKWGKQFCKYASKQCCKSCAADPNADPNCPYGDRAGFCKTMPMRNCGSPKNAKNCCERCKSYTGPTWGKRDLEVQENANTIMVRELDVDEEEVLDVYIDGEKRDAEKRRSLEMLGVMPAVAAADYAVDDEEEDEDDEDPEMEDIVVEMMDSPVLEEEEEEEDAAPDMEMEEEELRKIDEMAAQQEMEKAAEDLMKEMETFDTETFEAVA